MVTARAQVSVLSQANSFTAIKAEYSPLLNTEPLILKSKIQKVHDVHGECVYKDVIPKPPGESGKTEYNC